MPSDLRSVRIPLLAALACIALCALLVATAAEAATPVKRATRSCDPTTKKLDYLPDGSGYFTTNIKVTNVSCAYGRSFIVSYWRCRTSSGENPKGRCTGRVRGFSCRESNRTSTPAEINARVTCRRGGTQRIVHTYQQNIE